MTNLGAGGQDSSNRESNWKGWRLINTASALRAIPNLFLIRYSVWRAPLRSPQNWLTHSSKHPFYTPWHPAWERHQPILEKVLLPDSAAHWSRAAKKDQNQQKRLNNAQQLPVWQSGQGSLTWCELKHSQKKEQDICPELPILWVILSPSDYCHNSLIVLWVTIQIIHLLLPVYIFEWRNQYFNQMKLYVHTVITASQ